MAVHDPKARTGAARCNWWRTLKVCAAAVALGKAPFGHTAGLLVVGSDAGPTQAAEVSVRDGASLAVLLDGYPYLAYAGGVRVASGYVDADGTADIVTVPGEALQVMVLEYDGRQGHYLGGFNAFDASFTGGAYVASGDVDGDGHADILVGAGPGSSPVVKVFSGTDQGPLFTFFAYDIGFTGGVRVAAGDINGDGRADMIVAPGPGAPEPVRVFDGASGTKIADFYAFDAAFTGGMFVASADLNGDGYADMIVAADAGGPPVVATFDGIDLTPMGTFLAYPSGFTGGVRVAAGDLEGDGKPAIVTASGPGALAEVKAFAWPSLAPIHDFFPFSGFTGGAFVAVSPRSDVIFADTFEQ